MNGSVQWSVRKIQNESFSFGGFWIHSPKVQIQQLFIWLGHTDLLLYTIKKTTTKNSPTVICLFIHWIIFSSATLNDILVAMVTTVGSWSSGNNKVINELILELQYLKQTSTDADVYLIKGHK